MADGTIIYDIKNKGANPSREKIPSASTTENYYHESLERGRMLEKSIGDAADWAKKIKKDLTEKITLWLKLQVLGTDGQLPDTARPAKYIKDVIDFIKEMKKLMDEVVAVISALIRIAQMIIAMINRFKAMIQRILNALAALIAEICNWNLPDLPALPNFFGDLVWGFNGFNLGKIDKFTFDAKFAFGNCKIRKPDLNIFRNYPTQINGSNKLTYGQQLFNPPLGGILAPKAGTDPDFVRTYLDPKRNYTPIFTSDFSQSVDMIGSLPKPSTILSNYSLSPANYAENLVSLVPSLVPLIPKTTDADYEFINEPNDTPDITTQTALRRQNLQTAFEVNVNLGSIVDSGYDLNLTAAWVLYLSRSLEARQGLWIEEFKALYDDIILPTVTMLQTEDIPFNGYEGVIKNAPANLPIIDYFKSVVDGGQLSNVYWQLSYIENSLLGYARDKRWDSYAYGFLSPVTKTDADFAIKPLSATTSSVILDSDGKASYPQEILVPTSHLSIALDAIEKGKNDIENHPEWRTSRSQFRYIYDQFAQAKEVDRYSQFWREWKANFESALVSEVSTRVLSYWQALDSQVNPLGDSAIADYIRIDTETRSSSWVPGDGLLNLPKELFPETIQAYDDTKPSGWTGDTFDASTFLARPDIQALSIPTQMAMVDLNSAYASILTYQTITLDAMNSQLTSVQDSITSASAVQGISLSSAAVMTLSSGETKTLVLPTIEFDHTSNFVSPTLIKIQANGEYSVACLMNTSESVTPDIRKLEMLVNGKVELAASSDNTTQASAVGFSGNLPLVMGDEVYFRASNAGVSSFDILDSTVSCLIANPSQAASTGNSAINGYPVGVDSLDAGTAVAINAYSKILPIHPEVNVDDVPWYDGITLASGKANETVQISLIYGNTYTIPSAHFTPGANLFVGPNGVLTEDFTMVKTTCRWVIGVGKAISATDFIYEPQLPMDTHGTGTGGGVVSGNYIFTQTVPSDTWIINHNLGHYVPITLMYMDGRVFEADIIYGTIGNPNDMNTIRVYMSRPVAGKAICGEFVTGTVSFDFGEV